MLRSLVKTGICKTLHITGLDRLARSLVGSSGHTVVLGYHRVVDDFPSAAKRVIPGMLVSRRMFEQQLDWLGRNFDILPLDSLGAALDDGGKVKRPIAAITFDDGYRDNFENAYPILMKKGIPASVFVSTDFIESQQLPVHDRLYHALQYGFARWHGRWRGVERLFRQSGVAWTSFYEHSANLTDSLGATHYLLSTLPHADIRQLIEPLESSFHKSANDLDEIKPLTWEMISTMAKAGITIGSHTRTHILLANESPDRVAQETLGSRQDLEAKLGIPIRHFAYPAGCFNRRTVQAVAAAGYHYAYTTCRHHDPDYPLLTIPRRPVWETTSSSASGSFSPAIMSCQLNGVFDMVSGQCGQNHGFRSKGHSAPPKPGKLGWVQ